jgi:transketolase C-terminal domain/subunit
MKGIDRVYVQEMTFLVLIDIYVGDIYYCEHNVVEGFGTAVSEVFGNTTLFRSGSSIVGALSYLLCHYGLDSAIIVQ